MFFPLEPGTITTVAASDKVWPPPQRAYVMRWLGSISTPKRILWATNSEESQQLQARANAYLHPRHTLSAVLDPSEDPYFEDEECDTFTFCDAIDEAERLNPDILVIDAAGVHNYWDKKRHPEQALTRLMSETAPAVIFLRTWGASPRGRRMPDFYFDSWSTGDLPGNVVDLHLVKNTVAAICTKGPNKGEMHRYTWEQSLT